MIRGFVHFYDSLNIVLILDPGCEFLTKFESVIIFLSKNVKAFHWLLKSKFIIFMTKGKLKNGNEIKSDIFPWNIHGIYFNDFQNWNFSVSWLKWTQEIEMKQNQTFSQGTYSNLALF